MSEFRVQFSTLVNEKVTVLECFNFDATVMEFPVQKLKLQGKRYSSITGLKSGQHTLLLTQPGKEKKKEPQSQTNYFSTTKKHDFYFCTYNIHWCQSSRLHYTLIQIPLGMKQLHGRGNGHYTFLLWGGKRSKFKLKNETK